LGGCCGGGGRSRSAVFRGRRCRPAAGLDVQVSCQQRVVRAAVAPLDDVIDQAVDGGGGCGRGYHDGLCVGGTSTRVRWRIFRVRRVLRSGRGKRCGGYRGGHVNELRRSRAPITHPRAQGCLGWGGCGDGHRARWWQWRQRSARKGKKPKSITTYYAFNRCRYE